MLRFLFLSLWLTISPTADDIVSMHVERLPDLNIPRSAHSLVYADGELTAIGGHTTGFLLTNTAEYYKDGRWHLVETLYPHDFGAVAVLPSGDFIVAGGCDEPFGIGRSFGVERYDPATHSFTALPILDAKRTRFTMALLSDHTLLVSGNWYDTDGIGRYTPEKGGQVFQAAAQGRCQPYILQTSPDNAFIFSYTGNHTDRENLEHIVVDQLQGESFEEPLLQEWRPVPYESNFCMADLFIGDEALGGYAWLIPARRADGQTRILKLVGESISLLETEKPIPTQDPDGHPIQWAVLNTDRAAENAYLRSDPLPSGRIFVCKIGYGEALRGRKAPITIYCADVWDQEDTPLTVVSSLLPNGRIAVAGGYKESNYQPISDAFILHTEPLPRRSAACWWILAGILLICAAAAGALIYLRKKREDELPEGEHLQEIEQRLSLVSELMARIQQLMEEKELFKNPDLKVEDIAEELGTNAAYVRQCITGAYGGSFKNFVNEYRVRYVQQSLKKNPEAKITALALDAGFSSTATFYRNFTAVTGLSPAAWLKQQQ